MAGAQEQTRQRSCLNLIATTAVGGIICAGLLALGYAACALLAAGNSLEAFRHYSAALEYSQQRECDKAAAELEEVVRLDGLGLFPDARRRLNEAEVCQKENHYARGIEALKAADWQRAADEFALVVALDPDYRDAGAGLEEARRRIGPASSPGEPKERTPD